LAPGRRFGAARRKKKLTCGRSEDPAIARGRKVYNYRCYFCHGYDGDARTEAAAMLDPVPRDFTAARDLTRADILEALRQGRPGTAMKDFSALLSPREMRDVAAYVAEVFVACGAHNTRYHTAENGWPDHRERYGQALPFATGAIALDAPARSLSARQKRGRALFRSACISCHEGRIDAAAPLALTAGAAEADSPAQSGATHRARETDRTQDGHAQEYEHEYDYETRTIHDIPPEIDDPDARERRGRRLYARTCETCHAADGSGQNWIGKFLEPSPPDFRSDAFAERFDAGWFSAVTLDAPPGTTMPSFTGVLSRAEVEAIAAYVRRAFVETPAGRSAR